MERTRFGLIARRVRLSGLFVLTAALCAPPPPALAEVDLPGTSWTLEGATKLTLRARGQTQAETLPELVTLVFDAGASNEGGACSFTISGTENNVELPCTFTAKTPRRPGAATKLLIDLDDEPLRAEIEAGVRDELGDPGAEVTLSSRRARGKIDPVSGLLEIDVSWRGKIVLTIERLTIRALLASDLSGTEDALRPEGNGRRGRGAAPGLIDGLLGAIERARP